MDTVSIIMPLYNGEHFLEKSVLSVVAQTYTAWELWVIEDHSTDHSLALAKRLAERDARIHVLQTPKNMGAAGARNLGIQHAAGRYLAFLDCDDFWYPRKLEVQIAFMQEHGADFSCTAYRCVSETGEPVKHRTVVPFRRAGYWRCLFYGNCIGNSTAVYDAQKLGKVESPDLRKRNDFAMWLQLLRRTPYVYGLRECLADYCVRRGSLSGKKLNLYRYQWILYRKIERLPLLTCVAAIVSVTARKLWQAVWKR